MGLWVDRTTTMIQYRTSDCDTTAVGRQRQQVKIIVAHLFLNVLDGVRMKSEQTQSRFNVHFVVAALHEIAQIIRQEIFVAQQITIVTPYREQATQYRNVIGKAQRDKTWEYLKLHEMNVFTIDSFQGGQNKLIVFDTVLAKSRIGG
ncbi:hypothetical protein ACLMJK_002754 [Lecanora helva]